MQVKLPIPEAFAGEVIYHRANQIPLVNNHTHRHAELELNLVCRGRGTCLVEGRRSAMGVNSCLWLFDDQEHMLIEQSPDFEMWICLFRPGLVDAHREYINDPVLNDQHHDGIFLRLLGGEEAALIESLCQRLLQGATDAYRFNQGLNWLFLECWQLFESSAVISDLPHVPQTVEHAVQLLQRDDYDLGELAAAVGVSDSWLSRSMHRHLGLTFSEFRNRQRIERFFQIYGRGQRKNMTQSAFEAGFNSYAQFYKVFRHICGRTPRQIARELRQQSAP